MTNESWTEIHNKYSQTDWANKPSMFAEQVREYLPESGSLLELGAGIGQDSEYFASLGYKVTSTDLDIDALQKRANGNFIVQTVDLSDELPFDDNSFDSIYAHLSLHYFDLKTTERIFDDIFRVLKPGGIFAFFTNSVDDPEYGTGVEIEPDYFEIDGMKKRYMNVESVKQVAHAFKPLVIDNEGETYKDSAKGIHHLIRFIGKK